MTYAKLDDLTLFAAIGMLLAGCGAPPYPSDSDHKGATDDQCIECHVDGNEGRLPDGHYEEGEVRDDLKDCTGCHQAGN